MRVRPGTMDSGHTYSGKKQVGRNLAKHICRTPDRVGIVEFVSVERQVLFHAAV